MEQNINKPASMLKEDFVNALVDLVNRSGLPYFLLEYIFKDLLNQLHNAAQSQLQEDTANYNKMLAARSAQQVGEAPAAEPKAAEHDEA